MIHPQTHSIGPHTLQYLDYGGDNPPLILIHATGFLPWMWQPVADALGKDFRIIAPFFCNHRSADPENGGLGWQTLAEDLQSLSRHLNLTNPALVGHSMGATVATLYHTALKMPADKLVLIEPIFLPREIYTMPLTVAQHPLASKAIKRRDTWQDRKEARLFFESKPFFQSWDKEMLSLYVTHGVAPGDGGGVHLTCSPRCEAALFMGSRERDPWPLLPDITCPTLVVEGETSENRPWIDLPAVAKLIPDAVYQQVPNVGHLVPMEKPGETALILRDFLLGYPPTKKATLL